MKLPLLLLVLVFSTSLNAQTFNKLFSFTSGNYTNEYSYAGIESANGNYLIGIGNRLLCLSANGDSLWSKIYTGYGDITKLFRDNTNQLIAATTKGKMVFLKIDEANGDTISSIKVPVQYSNSGYTIYDALVLPDGDIVYSYNNGGSYGAALVRFTPGSTTNRWSNDYAGENWGPRGILLDDTCLVVAGYQGVANYRVNLFMRKISLNNTTQWSANYYRNTSYADRMIGIQKSTNGNYLIATSFNFNDVLAPSIAIVSNAGDSVAVNHFEMLDGKKINHGYLTSLQPNGTNGFYAAGYLNIAQLSPDNAEVGMGYMTAFSIDNNGVIHSGFNFNYSGFYQYSPGSPYSGTEGWGNGCFRTSDGYYLLFGVGSKIHDPGTGAAIDTQWRGYVAKSNQFVSSVQSVHQESTNYSIFPNPIKNVLSIQSSSKANELTIKIHNISGSLVRQFQLKNQSNLKLDLPELSRGAYFITIESETEKSVLKFVKE
jgi:hypothetical protein